MKATIKIVTAQKEFSKEDMDAMRRILNVLRAHELACSLTIKKKTNEHYTIHESKLEAV